MKKSFVKTILSVLLALIVLLTPALCAFARNTEQERTCPFINVHGFMASDIYKDKNDPDNDDLVWPPTADDILGAVKTVLPDVFKFIVTKNYDALADAIIEPVNGVIGKGNLDWDGTVKDNSGIRFEYPAEDEITKESELSFRYDWRIDPVEVASQLNDFIEYVCKASGCSQVVLECHSFGGIITLSYVTKYGTDRLKAVCYNSTAIYGGQYIGELLTGNIVLNDEAVTAYFKAILSENEYSKLLNGVFDFMKASGITGDICKIGNDLILNCGEKIIREVVAPMFAGWLSIWAMIPDEYIDDAMSYVFDGVYKNDGIDHSGLKSKIENYNKTVRARKTETLVAQNRSKTNVYIISRYGFCSVPLSDSCTNMSDTVLDTKNTSMGGTACNYNKSFSAKYLERHDSKYISPDKTVDAATCLFPDQTWFFKGITHAASADGFGDFTLDLLYSKEQATVDTYEKYPQFMKRSGENTIVIDDGIAEEPDAGDKMFSLFIKIISKLSGFSDSIKDIMSLPFKALNK